MFKVSNKYRNLCTGITLNCTINDCFVYRIKKCVLVLLEILCITLCEVCFCPPVCLFVVLLSFFFYMYCFCANKLYYKVFTF